LEGEFDLLVFGLELFENFGFVLELFLFAFQFRLETDF
jgi:hypothetical protein